MTEQYRRTRQRSAAPFILVYGEFAPLQVRPLSLLRVSSLKQSKFAPKSFDSFPYKRTTNARVMQSYYVIPVLI